MTRADLRKELKKFEKIAAAVKRGDVWQNAATGLGIAGRDWTQGTQLGTDATLQQQQIDDLYAQDNLAARIVDAPAEDAIRNWFELTGTSGGAEKGFQRQIFAEWDRLHVKSRMLEWLKRGRKDGGGALLVGTRDSGGMDQELDPESVTELRHLHFVERWRLLVDDVDPDPQSDTFNKPLHYVLLPLGVFNYSISRTQAKALRERASNEMRIHASRVIAYPGIQISDRRTQNQQGWGDSALQRPYWSIQNYRVLWAHIATVFKHVAQTVIKFGGYAELNAGAFGKEIRKRLNAIQQMRSTLSILPLDAKDEFHEQTLTGLAGALEVLRYAQEDLAQAANEPITKLFGHLPGGFGKDDEAGRDNWYGLVHGIQEDYLLEPLRELVLLTAAALKIAPPKDWAISFCPLDIPNDDAAATIDLAEAQADGQRIGDGVIDPEEAREALRIDRKSRYPLKDGPAKAEASTMAIAKQTAETAASAKTEVAAMKPAPAKKAGL